MKKVLLALAITLSATLSFAQTNLGTKPTLQLVRNATLLIEYGGKKILVDPMLSPKGAIESWAGIYYCPVKSISFIKKEVVGPP
ncbi:MAG: hypothetical protein ACTHK8_03670 [Ginsengibacter sp.]